MSMMAKMIMMVVMFMIMKGDEGRILSTVIARLVMMVIMMVMMMIMMMVIIMKGDPFQV